MNISSIIGLRSTTPNVEQKQQNQVTNFGLRMASPLAHDTVSFTSTAKNANRAYGATKQVAVAVAAYAEGRQSEVNRFAKTYFGDLFRIEGMPTPEKALGAIKLRAKSWSSILDKSGSGKWASEKEIIDEMTDLNGMKFTLDDASKANVHHLLGKWGQLVKKGIIELDEIEIKRPKKVEKLDNKNPEKYIYDYASESALKKLAQIQYDKTGKNLLDKNGNIPVDYTKGNYPAIHILAHFPGAKHGFEIQIDGIDVDLYKSLDDLLFKILNGKNVAKKYCTRFKTRLAPLMENTDEAQKLMEKMDKYRGDVFLFQRLKEPTKHDSRKINFPPPIYDLPENLHMNKLWELKMECDKIAAKASKTDTKTKKK